MFLYIDPGTGSMLFSVVIGLIATLYFVLKAVIIKLKFIFMGKNQHLLQSNRIPYVIYSESSRYWVVFEPIVEEFEKRKIPLVYFTATDDDPFYQKKYEFVRGETIGEGNKAFSKLNFLEADIVLMTTPGLDVYQLKRSKGVKHYCHVFHSIDDATGYRLFGLDYYDSVLLTGTHQEAHVRLLEKQRNLQAKEMSIVGSTYLDYLSKKVLTLPPAQKNGFTVLVAPSWGKSGLLSLYGEKLLDPLLKTGFDIIVRPHPQSVISEKNILNKLEEKYKNEKNITWDFNRENLISLQKADIMISDFSCVIFDYAFLFDKTILYANQDFDDRPYDAGDIPEEPWRFRILPKIGVPLREDDFSNIKEILTKAASDKTLAENRKNAKNEAWKYQGQSAEKILDYLIEKEKECQTKQMQ